MGRLADRLDGIRVRVRAPGADIEAELRNRTDITITFGESVYEFADERGLERSLAALARLVYAGWLRQYRAAIDESARYHAERRTGPRIPRRTIEDRSQREVQ